MANKGFSLHIGLNRVDPAHYDNWDGQLFACENDSEFMESIAKNNGYATKRLWNEDATSDKLLKEMDRFVKELVSGDILLLTYSGHGGSLPDLNGDEEDEFRNDETWCLFDRQFVDDELFECFSKFRAGVRILMFSDSCHSGTVSRVVEEELEIDKELAELYKKHKLIPRIMPREKIGPTYKNNKAKYDTILKKPAPPKDGVAAFVLLFAACQDQETAKEWGDHGIFTGVIKKLQDATFPDYDSFFAAIKKKVPQRYQAPNIYKYGNLAFDFSAQAPFSINGKSVTTVTKPASKQKRKRDVDANNTDLIIHTNDKSRVRSRDASIADRDDAKYYDIKKENASIAEAWDKAYELYLSTPAPDKSLSFVEPNIKSKYVRLTEDSTVLSRGESNNYLNNWPQPEPGDTEFIWHLDDQHSQLRKAFNAITAKFGDDFNDDRLKIRIGHIDTGYLDHISKPVNLKDDLGVSFVKDEYGVNKGKDRLNSGFPAEQDGHGCATMAILAGNKIVNAADSYTGYTGYYGAIPFAEVVPIRICETVYNLFNANDVADGIDYAVDYGCEVITMSMAGYPTRRVADAVNRAYNKGVVIVTANGNNWFKGIQKITPKAVMYPARFERVTGAAGACYNHFPYDYEANRFFMARMDAGETMQGNWGPDNVMKTVVAGYTPNLPWATIRGKDKFYRSGGGTSSATPQVAAAFALWIVYNRDKIQQHGLDGSWKKVEAARKAIFRAASKSFPQYKKYYGNGVIRAFDAFDKFDFDNEINSLSASEEAKVKFGGLFQFIGQWFRGRSSRDTSFSSFQNDDVLQEMVSLEIMQLIYRSVEDGGDEKLMKYAEVLEFENEDAAEFLQDEDARKDFFEAIKKSDSSSTFLKGIIK